ncbi:MAG: ATP-binding cassette domain-containing protein, partial [Elusimicrobiota bacterium]
MTEVILSFDQVTLGYQKEIILKNINCQIAKGSFIGIVGPNGSGKTTFLRAALGLIAPLKGNVTRNKNQHFSYVSQLGNTSQLWPLTIKEVVELGV